MILAYHRVAELPCDPWALAVSPCHFSEQLEVITRTCHPMSLAQAIQRAAEDRLPDRAVAITFDDGYADNLHVALPALERFGLPATFFLTNQAIGAQEEFWWDELEHLLLAHNAHPAWRAWEPAPTESHRRYQESHPVLQRCPAAARSEMLHAMRPTGQAASCRPTHRTLTEDEVRTLAADSQVEIGSHTVSHPVLRNLPARLQMREMVGSRRKLEALLERKINFLAYPYGRAEHYSSASMAFARQAGFAAACSFQSGGLSQKSDPFALPRCGVSDWDGEEFSIQLSKWFRD